MAYFRRLTAHAETLWRSDCEFKPIRGGISILWDRISSYCVVMNQPPRVFFSRELFHEQKMPEM